MKTKMRMETTTSILKMATNIFVFENGD